MTSTPAVSSLLHFLSAAMLAFSVFLKDGNLLVTAINLLSRKNMLFSGKESSELTAYSCRNQPELLSLHHARLAKAPDDD